MTFLDELERFKAFRLKYLTTLLSPLPTDMAKVHFEKQSNSALRFEAEEWAADLEAFYQTRAAREYEKPDCKSWEYAQALAAEEKRWFKKAQAAVNSLEQRAISLGQTIKVSEGRA